MKRYLVAIIVAVLLIEVQSENTVCREECIKLRYPRCQICYDKCTQSPLKEPEVKFKRCWLQKCTDYDHDCLTSELLEQQCLQTCCISYPQNLTYAFLKQCRDTNRQTLQKKHNDQNMQRFRWFLIALIIFITFMTTWATCCCQQLRKQIANQRQLQSLESKPCNKQSVCNLEWEETKQFQLKTKQSQSDFEVPHIQSKKCLICKKPGSNMRTQCNHNFHIMCYRLRNLKWWNNCPHCEKKQPNPFYIICQNCQSRQAYFVMYDDIKDLQQVLHFMKVICNRCLIHHLETGNNIFLAQSPEYFQTIHDQFLIS